MPKQSIVSDDTEQARTTALEPTLSAVSGAGGQVLITGSSGWLASRLAHRLKADCSVILFGRQAPMDARLRCAWLPNSMLDLEDSARSAIETNSDVIVNCAAVTKAPQTKKDEATMVAINGIWPGLLAKYASSNRSVHLVQISTDAVFDGTRGNYREHDHCRPVTSYGESKRLGEIAVGPDSARVLVIRTNFIGWHPRGLGFVNSIAEALRVCRPYEGYVDYITSSMHVDRLAHLIAEVITTRVSGILHLASIDSASKADQVGLILDALGKSDSILRRVPAPAREDRPIGRYDISLNTQLARDSLSLSLSSMRSCLQSVAEEIRQFG